MSGFDIRDLRKNQAEKYAKVKEQEENEKKQQEELKRIEAEHKMLQEVVFKNEFEDFIDRLDVILINIHNCNNILEMDMYVESFKQQLEQNIKFVETEYCKEELAHKVTELINCVSQSDKTKFNITVKDSNTEAAQRITNHVKQIMNICKFNENDVQVELMDTTQDEDMAKKLQDDDNKYDMEFHKFIPIHQRLGSYDDLPDLMDDEFVPNNIPLELPHPTVLQEPKPVIDNPEYYVGFDAIDDPELIQLSYFQNDLLDD
jgi:hypothetical protein